jgi:hypothetical protein
MTFSDLMSLPADLRPHRAGSGSAPDIAGGGRGAPGSGPGRRTARSRHRRRDSRLLLGLFDGCGAAGNGGLQVGRRHMGQPSPSPDGRTAVRGLRAPRSTRSAPASEGCPTLRLRGAQRWLATRAAGRGRGTGECNRYESCVSDLVSH